MVENKSEQLLALLLPSKGRFIDLILTLLMTSLKSPKGFRAHFVVCANYSSFHLAILRSLFRDRATFIDERNLKWLGMTGAYNYALEEAAKIGARWVALWADDLLPESPLWLEDLFSAISRPAFHFGIFSSDEGNHKAHFGWNVFAGYPCAHFFVALIDALPGFMLNPKLRAYVGDNEIVVNRTKNGVPIDLLPIRVIHQPTPNMLRSSNSSSYKTDLETVYQIHPELAGKLDAIVLRGDTSNVNCRFIVDNGQQIRFGKNTMTLSISEFKAASPYTIQRVSIRIVAKIREIWNWILLAPKWSWILITPKLVLKVLRRIFG